MNTITKEHARQNLHALRRAMLKANSTEQRELQALIDRITLCNSIENEWNAEDAINFQTGELYNAYGQYWNCNSKLCPTCTAQSSRRARKLLIQRIQLLERKRGDRISFPTLTIKNPNLPLIQTRQLFNRAWQLLRKRKFWCDTIIGGFKSEEFTLTASGYHYHIHLLIQSRFILFNEFRRIWTECVEKAFNEHGLELHVNTIDKLLIVRFEKINDIQSIPNELCKYITKTDSWSKIKTDDLKELALVRRWHRTREFFGSWQSPQKEDQNELEPILDKSDLSDGVFSAVATQDAWQDRVFLIGNERYRIELREEFERRRTFRRAQLKLRWKDAVFREPQQTISAQ